MKLAIFCDIDGTLANCDRRLKYLPNWNEFFAHMGEDEPVEPIAALLKELYGTRYAIILCSGRPETYRSATETWLTRAEISYDRLYMRPEGDFRKDAIVKRELLAAIRSDGYEPMLVIDDRPSVVEMWRNEGLVCLQARHHETPVAAPTGILTLMIGPSGAGKTTWLASNAATELGIRSSHIVSSDEIRIDLCGDFRDQTRNAEVFAAIHKIARTRVESGLPCVIDATHLRNADRRASRDCAPKDTAIRYIVLDRPTEAKRAFAGWRAELGFDLIAKHEATFKSNLAAILAGDDDPRVTVIDLRRLRR